MKTLARPDEVTAAACRWLANGGGSGEYSGPDPGDSHDLSPLLARETGRKNLSLSSAASWIRMVESLGSVLNLIDGRGSPVWAFKGFDLAQSVYPFPGARPMADADLYIEQEDSGLIVDSFLREGWSVTSPGNGIFNAGIVSEMKLRKQDLLVELHTHLFYFPALFPGRLPSDLLRNGRPLRPGLMGFSWHNSLLAVLVHMLINEFTRPIWWTDITLLCLKVAQTSSWKPFVRSALSSGVGKSIGLLLETSASAAGTPVPPPVTDTLRRSGSGGERILGALKLGRMIPSLLNLWHLTGWKKVSWFYAMLLLALTGKHPLKR